MKRSSLLILLLMAGLLLLAACRTASTALPELKVTSITPARGSSAGGQAVTVSGEAFFEVLNGRYPASLSVTVCGAPLSELRVAGEVRTTVLPGGGSASVRLGTSLSGVTTASSVDGSADVVVRLPDGRQAVLKDAFECFDPAPHVTAFMLTPQPAALGQPALFSWQALDPAAGSLDCELDPGDGSSPYRLAGCQEKTEQAHAYASTGEFTARLTVTSAGGAQSSVTLPVSVLNQAPMARPDVYATPADTELLVAAPGVLQNDTLNSGSLASARLPGSAGGSLDLITDGSFSYQPAAGFTGHETFSYELHNAAGSSSGSITITVGEVPEANDDDYLALQDEPLIVAAPGLLANDRLKLALLDADAASAEGGTVSVAPDGAFTYVPPAGFSGFDSFGYRLSNGLATVSAAVTIHVRLAAAASDDLYVTPFETILQIDAATGVLVNDQGEPAPVVVDFDALSQHGGSVVITADGSFSFTPAPGFTGPDAFSYLIANGVGADAAGQVMVQVGAAPLAVDDGLAAIAGEGLTLAAPGVFGNDQVNAAVLASYTQPASGAALALAADGSLTYLPAADFTGTDTFSYTLSNGMGSSTATVSVDVRRKPEAVDRIYVTGLDQELLVDAAAGLLAGDPGVPASVVTDHDVPHENEGTLQINAADGSISFMPAAGFTGVVTLGYAIGNGVGAPVPATITIQVGEVPEALDDLFELYVDEVLNSAAPGVLGNDRINGAVLALDTSIVPLGSITLAPDGSFSYTPPDNFAGADSFGYTLMNGLGSSDATVNINVKYPGAPAAQPDAYTVLRDEELDVEAPGLFDNDALNGGALDIFDVSSRLGGTVTVRTDGALTYRPSAGTTGQDSFTYTLGNPIGSSTATVTIDIQRLPEASDDHYATPLDRQLAVPAAEGLLANDEGVPAPRILGIDADGTAGTVEVQPDGSFIYTPVPAFTGTDSFRYTITNAAGGPSSAEVTVRVGEVPQAADDEFEVIQDQLLTITLNELLQNDDAQAATLSLPSATSTEGGSITIDGDGVHYLPVTGFTGADTFSYLLTNGLGTSDATVTLGVYQQAVAVADAFATPLNTQLNVAAPGPLTNDTGMPLPWVKAADPTSASGATITLAVDGMLIYDPVAGYTGNDTFSYVVSNGFGSEVSATVTVRVGEEPVAENDAFEVTVDTQLADAAPGVLENDEVNGAVLQELNLTGSDGGSLELEEDGAFTYQPAPGFWGEETFSYTLENGLGQSSATVTFAVYSKPVAVDDHYETAFNTPLQIDAAAGVLKNDSGKPLPAVELIDGDGAAGTLELTADGGLSYTPMPGFTGHDTFTYLARNLQGGAEATVTIKVGETAVAVNDGPFEVLGNVAFNSQTYSVLDDDEGDALSLDLDAFSGTSSAGGSVMLNADGTFTYDPPPGFVGDDSFSYTVFNGFGPSTGTVSLEVSDMIWFVDADFTEEPGKPGDGRFSNPFNSLQKLDAVEDRQPGTIFLHAGNLPHAGPLQLQPGERLIGQSASGSLADLAGITVPDGSAELPELLGPAGTETVISVDAGGIRVDRGNRLQGFSLRGGAASSTSRTPALHGSNIGTLQVSDVNISTQGNAIDLAGGTLQAVFPGLHSSGGTQGMRLSNLAGSLALTGSLTHQMDGLLVEGGDLAVSFAGDISGLRPLTVRNRSGSVTVSGEVSGGSVLLENNPGGTVSVGSLDLVAQDAVALSMIDGGELLLDGPDALLESTGQTALLIMGTSKLELEHAAISSAGSSCVNLIVGGSSQQVFSLTGDSTVSGCTVGVQLAAVEQGKADITLTDNKISSGAGSGISLHAEKQAQINAWIIHNTVTSSTTGNNSFGIDVITEEGGRVISLIADNTVSDYAFGLRTGVRGTGSGAVDVTLTGNTISSGGSWAGAGAWFLAGTGDQGEAGDLCVNLTGGNTIRADSSAGYPGYLLDQYAGTQLALQGFASGSAATFIAQYDPGASVTLNPGAIISNRSCVTP